MKEFKFAFVKVLPILFSYVVVGIACGILYRENGFTIYEMLISSGIIYSGALQFVLAPLIVSGASVLVIALISLVLSGRHIFYGVAMIEKLKINSVKGIYTAATITDETFSIISSIENNEADIQKVYFYVNLIAHFTWILSTLVVFGLGNIIPFDTTGIEFSATALFVAIAVSQTVKSAMFLPQILAVISSFLAMKIVGVQNFVMLGMAITVVGLFAFKKQIKERLNVK